MKQTQESFYNICRYIIFKNITIYVISIKFLFFNELLANHLYSDKDLDYSGYSPAETDIIISREKYLDQLQGFWLGQSIGNWTGLITEMDKIEPPFYTDENWGKRDQKNIWESFISPKDTIITYYFVEDEEPWFADDDTDIEYMYQHLLDIHNVSILSSAQIKEGWLNHKYSNETAPKGENFLWVSNETAFYLMLDGLSTPQTSEPENNPYYSMIDAQLTTEIFGLFSPVQYKVALKMAELPIRVTAKFDAEWVSKFYVKMHSLSSYLDSTLTMKEQIHFISRKARKELPDSSYSAKMYDFIEQSYLNNPDKNDWEKTRDEVYVRYQLNSNDGYTYKNPFDSGINFAASLISLFYGSGNFKRTIQIGTLTGWDSDNPTATWGGLLGFILGKKKLEKIFNKYDFSDQYWIHRTRKNFVDRTEQAKGEDSFQLMAIRALFIIDRVVIEEMNGGVNLEKNIWYIPNTE